MDTLKFLCLSCGNLYEVDPPAEDGSGEEQCPRCKGASIVKLDVFGLFGAPGKGG